MSKKDKIITNVLKATTAIGLGLIYLVQRKIIKEQDKIIEDQFEMLKKSSEQTEELEDICMDFLNYSEKDKEKLKTKAEFTVVKKREIES